MPAPAASYSLRLVRYPGQAHDVLGACTRFREQLDDSLQRSSDLGGEIPGVVALLVAAGLSRQHDPSAGSIDLDAVRESPRFRPFGRLQNTHLSFLPFATP